ncbi:uncharacterized protein LOC6583976 isoform X2 [Drosophila mojavensis]|uniref:uncharacterized protein LOC6583976 isoform X2 n=1 Tax=Drosophila mojavensis TaxID=7230 RepID=UPI001CD10A98|nr:uncharacterized protein LOC6583976 isoform X2 [Drosophila mojavensis]
MCQAKHCASKRHSQSNSASRAEQSCSCSCSSSGTNRIPSYTVLLAALAALLPLLPLTHARHLHDQLALGFAYEDADSSSGSGASVDSSRSLPAWHANPFYGLVQSYADSENSENSYSSYNSDSSDDSSDASSSSSSSSSSGSGSSIFDAEAESESSYEQITQAAMKAVKRELQRQRIRHRRSHALQYFARTDAAPEWENPCGGVYQPDRQQPKKLNISVRAKRNYLKLLRNNTLIELQDIRKAAKLDYGDIQAWQREYTFLPNMTRPTNKVMLQTWYRGIQTFVGSFAYLGKAHYKYQKEHQLPIGKSTEELHKLLVSARRVLCEIETTINASYPNSNVAKLNQVSRAKMQADLDFYTPADGSKEADKRDLKFTKQLYFQFLDNMSKSLHRALNKRKQRRHSAESQPHSSAVSNSRQAISLESSEGSRSGQSAQSGQSGQSTGTRNDSGCSNFGDC